MNIMSVEVYQAKITYDAELDMFRGEILGLNGGADSMDGHQRNCGRSFANRCTYSLRCAVRRGLRLSDTIQARSISGFRPSCMRASPYALRPKGRA
jgi:hypothetical protein